MIKTTQVKIFNASTILELENQANNFLKNNSDKKIVSIQISGQGQDTIFNGETHLSLIIVYIL
jgi:hypothetical protein